MHSVEIHITKLINLIYTACTANCKLCQGRSCSVCEHGHALYKGYHQRGKGVCVKKCPTGYKVKLNPVGGNECIRGKYLEEMISFDLIVKHIAHQQSE